MPISRLGTLWPSIWIPVFFDTGQVSIDMLPVGKLPARQIRRDGREGVR